MVKTVLKLIHLLKCMETTFLGGSWLDRNKVGLFVLFWGPYLGVLKILVPVLEIIPGWIKGPYEC